MNKPEKMPKGYYGWSLVDGEAGYVVLKGALHNLHKNENGNSDAANFYAKGILIGVISTLVACGMNYDDACQLAWQCSPQGKDLHPERIPDSLREKFNTLKFTK